MRVLFYRDCRALNRIQIAKATVEGTVVSDPYTVSIPLRNSRLNKFCVTYRRWVVWLLYAVDLAALHAFPALFFLPLRLLPI